MAEGPTIDTWCSKWVLFKSENWSEFLEFQGVPEDKWDQATVTPDYHTYEQGSTTKQGGGL